MSDPTPPLGERTAPTLTERILNFLNRRDPFEGEIRHLLRDENSEEVDAALQKVRAFINDRRVLEAYLHAHEGRASLGRERMRRELEERFAPIELVEQALAELPDEPERAAALLRAERKSRTRAQAGRFLVSRGFDEDVAGNALERFFGEDA